MKRLALHDLNLYMGLFMITAYFATTGMLNMSLRRTITFIGTIPLYVIAFRDLFSSRYKTNECISLMILLSLLMGGYIVAENWNGYRLLYECSKFFCLYMISTVAIKKVYSHATFRLIAVTCVAVAVLGLMASFSNTAYIDETGKHAQWLVLGMTNSNLTGISLFGIYGILMIIFPHSKHKLVIFIAAVILQYLIVLSNSRSTMFASFIATGYALFFRRVKIPKSFILGLTLAAVVFVPVYLYMFYGLGLGNFKFDPAGEKKFFSGREFVYIQFLNFIKDSIWSVMFGNLGEAAFNNAHNGPLVIMSSIGVVGLIVVYGHFISKLLKINSSADTPEARIAIICISALYFQSCGDGALFCGVFTLEWFLYIYMMFAQKKIIIHPARRSEKNRQQEFLRESLRLSDECLRR